MNEQQVMEVVAPHAQAIRGFFVTALKRYHEEYDAKARADHDPSIRAQCLHGHIMKEAAKYAAGFPGSKVRLGDVRHLKHLLLDGRVAIRFKKLDRKLRPSNNETKQSLAFRCGGTIEGLEASMRVDAGYQLNLTGDEIQSVHIIRWSSPKKPHWHFELTEQEVKSTVLPLLPYSDDETEEAPTEIVPKPSEVVPFVKDKPDAE